MEIAHYRLKFLRPVVVGLTTLRERTGMLIRSTSGALGDVAPLPGWSEESLEDARLSLAKSQGADDGSLVASASWALYCLQQHCLEHQAAEAHEQALVPSARLLFPGDEAISGSTLKLKVGRRSVEAEVQWIKAAVKTGAKLRLDGNRSLHPADAERLADAAGEALEFFEEPSSPTGTISLLSKIPIALDEALLWQDIPEKKALLAKSWVIKPTALGTERTLDRVERAMAAKIQIVVSGAYESSIGAEALAAFAQRCSPNTVHGLGTSSFFVHDLDHESLGTLDWQPL